MYQYPGQMGMGQPMTSPMYSPMGNQQPQLPNLGPQTSQFVPQVPGQGNYPPSTQTAMRVRPVASYDEAKAVPTDFMGNMLILTDLSHGMIYTKVLDPSTGSSIFRAYQLLPEQAPQVAPVPMSQEPAFDFKGEVEKLRAELNAIKHELGLDKEVTA